MEPSYLRTVHLNHPILLSLRVQIVIDCNHYIRSRLVQKKCFSQTIIYVLVQYRRNISFKPLYTFSFSTKEIFLSNHYIRSFSFSTEEIFLSNHYIRSRLVQNKCISQTNYTFSSCKVFSTEEIRFLKPLYTFSFSTEEMRLSNNYTFSS